MHFHKVYKYLFPVLYFNNDNLLVFRRGAFYILEINNSNLTFKCKIRLNLFIYIASCIPILSRILRLTIRASVKNKENLLIFTFRNKIYEMDLNTFTISNGYNLNHSRPLNFEVIEGISCVDNGVYFGEYKSNPQKKCISIYKRQGVDSWEIVYTYPEGTIEHIHNIISDNYNDAVYILTGDFGNAAAIWKVRNNFEGVDSILMGNQNCRSCILFPTEEGLIYATDSPFSQNSIRILNNYNNEWVTNEICKINGPCIYGTKFNNDYIFSTSVEGEGLNSNFFYNLFSIKRGNGILDNNVCVYKGNLNDGFHLIYKLKKDKLPYLIFQFGTICFPSGEINGSYLPMFQVGTVLNDMSTSILKI